MELGTNEDILQLVEEKDHLSPIGIIRSRQRMVGVKVRGDSHLRTIIEGRNRMEEKQTRGNQRPMSLDWMMKENHSYCYLQTSKAPLKSQAQGTSLFTSAELNHRTVRGRLRSCCQSVRLQPVEEESRISWRMASLDYEPGMQRTRR